MSRDAILASLGIELEEIYRDHPENLTERLSHVQRKLAEVRDELRLEHRGGGDVAMLNLVNQVLTVLHSAGYPSGAVDWQQLPRASDLLRG